MKALKGWLALAQFIAFLQIIFGHFILPSVLHTGDESIYDGLGDEKIRPMISRWHDSQVYLASTATTAFGVGLFALTTLAWLGVKNAAAQSGTGPEKPA